MKVVFNILRTIVCFILLSGFLPAAVEDAMTIPKDSLSQDSPDIKENSIPANARQKLELLSYGNTPLKDVFRSLATKYNLNIFVDDAVNQQITVHLADISVHEAIVFLAQEYNLLLTLQGNIYKITMPEPVKPEPVPLNIRYENNLLTVDIKNEPLEKVIYAIQEKTGKNIILNRGVDGKISGFLQAVAFEPGLSTLLKSNGFVMRNKDGIYIIDREFSSRTGQEGKERKNFWIDVRDSLLYMEVMDAELSTIIQEASASLGINVITLGQITGKVNAQVTGLTFDRMMDYLFKGTDYTYRKDGDIYLIGDKKTPGMASIQMIKLGHLKAEGIIEQLPKDLVSKATLNVIKEHNAIMVVGSQDVISEVEEFIRQIDYPIPQVLIEAIVIDFETTDLREFSIKAQRGQSQDSTSNPLQTLYHLLLPEINMTATGGFLNKSLNYYGPKYNIGNIGKLPEDFLLNLRMLEQKGKVNIRSNPQIATLNGHTAFITIGTTQYYKLTSELLPLINNPSGFNQTTTRYEPYKAETRLEITPWVSATGEITTEIKPTFDEPTSGKFDSSLPPSIDHKELSSTVRLRDGETIVLGGLIKDKDEETISKYPILGDIPVIGKLFRNKTYNRSKKQLMIYVTPHLIYPGLTTPYPESIIK